MEPPAVGYNVFYNVNAIEVMLVVPDEAVEAYRSHPVWGLFLIETVTGVNAPQRSDAGETDKYTWYDLGGRRIANEKMSSLRGIFIKKQNSTDANTKKIFR